MGYWQETEAPVAACGQLLPLLGDVSHSHGWGDTGLFLEVGMRHVSWQPRCSRFGGGGVREKGGCHHSGWGEDPAYSLRS